MKRSLILLGRLNARRPAKLFAVSKETMRRIIQNDLRLPPYRVTNEPKLSEDQKIRRVAVTYWDERESMKEDHRKVLLSDESYFSLKGVFNRQNNPICASSRSEADHRGDVHSTSKCPKRIMV